MQKINCRYQDRCSGCSWIALPIEEQKRKKLESVRETLGTEIHWTAVAVEALRDRADLTWSEGRLGLFELEHTREILDIEACPMLSERMRAWLAVYRERQPPNIRKGSVRLRVAPNGQRGVWLDFANADIKALFEEREYLKWLSSQAIVEIGQRKKRLVWIEDTPKLRDPELFPWFETYTSEGKTIPLYGVIAGFTQSGFKGNRALVAEVLAQAKATGAVEWLELFAGSGNFALALAGSGFRVAAVELDALAIESMQRSAREVGLSLEATRADLHRPVELPRATAWVVDPPRSGLLGLQEEIRRVRPKHLIYVSCWTESFLADLAGLREMGYGVEQATAIDQFVHSPHVEWVTRLRLA